MPGPDRRTLLVAGLAALAGCTPATATPPTPAPTGATGPTPSPIPTATPIPTGSPTPARTPTPTGSPVATPSPALTAGWRTTVMSYNVLTGTRTGADFRAGVPDDDVRLARRVPVMADWIKAANPSIIGLQENEPLAEPVGRPLRLLGRALPQYAQVLPDCNVPILVRSTDYRIGDSEVRLISKRLFRRYLSWVRLTHRASGAELLMANTHLDPYQRPGPARARAAATDTILEILDGINPGFAIPTVLTGDLNTRAGEMRQVYREPLDLLARAGFQDAAVGAKDISEVPGAATLNSLGSRVRGRWRYRAIRWTGFRYDYVWVSEAISVSEWQVVTGPGVRWIDGWPYFAARPVPSDHCPVQATIIVPR